MPITTIQEALEFIRELHSEEFRDKSTWKSAKKAAGISKKSILPGRSDSKVGGKIASYHKALKNVGKNTSNARDFRGAVLRYSQAMDDLYSGLANFLTNKKPNSKL